MEKKVFRVVNLAAKVMTLTVAVLSIAGISITGLYPAIPFLWLLVLITFSTGSYGNRLENTPVSGRSKRYLLLTFSSILCILVLLWMTFVLMIDRVIPNWP